MDYLRRTGSDHGPLEMLTPRQREILQAIAAGKTRKEIAGSLDIVAKTVETDRSADGALEHSRRCRARPTCLQTRSCARRIIPSTPPPI